MKTIGFIGAGQMAQSLASGIASSFGSDWKFSISDPSQQACAAFKAEIGDRSSVVQAATNQDLVDASDVVFLAVKPQYLEDAVQGVEFKNSVLVVSVIAGVRGFQLERLTGTDRLIRVMPNTPCLIGVGASAMSAGENVDAADVELIRRFLDCVGIVVEIQEDLLDSVTGLSGSGPAYVFTFIEAMIDGAVLTGMPRTTARQLALQTVIGAAKIVVESGKHPAELRDQVTSPGGTTIEGLKALEENSFRDAVMSAVQAATERSRELG